MCNVVVSDKLKPVYFSSALLISCNATSGLSPAVVITQPTERRDTTIIARHVIGVFLLLLISPADGFRLAGSIPYKKYDKNSLNVADLTRFAPLHFGADFGSLPTLSSGKSHA
jgi:hypothetical protein